LGKICIEVAENYPFKEFANGTSATSTTFREIKRPQRDLLPLLWWHNPDSAFGIVVFSALENSVRVPIYQIASYNIKRIIVLKRHQPPATASTN